jgi:uncharacterized membrane protein
MSTARLEAFSDGVIAVAITLLVLDIRVPPPGHRDGHGHVERLIDALGSDWPHYAAYVVSFATIGIIWINHHAMIARLREADHSILVLNVLLLMTIVAIPFATSLMATYLRASTGQHLAAALYSGVFLAMAVAFTALNAQILLRRPQLMGDGASLALRRATFRRASAGLVPYAIATALAAVSPYVTLAICGALAAFYALPVASRVSA